MAIQMGKAVPRRSINLEGAIFVPHSLAHVNRELALALLRQGVDIGLRSPENERPELFPEERYLPLTRCPSYPEPEVIVRHHWPPRFSSPGDAFLVQIIHWEYGALPVEWCEKLPRNTHELWVLSSAVRDAFVRAGFDAERIAVVGGGVDLQVFHPQVPPLDLPTRKGFRFLFVGAPILRKGIDLLLEAYQQEFGADEDVTLVVKDVPAYANHGCRELLRAAASDGSTAEVCVLTEDLPAASMPGLYTACQAVVQPYRGEGLCLPILEAMAAGVPVAGTAAGASLDYLNQRNGFPIAASEEQFAENQVDGVETAGRPFWARPDRVALRRVLRRMYEDQTESARRAEQARRDVGVSWTWERAAATARGRLDAMLAERDGRLRALALLMEASAALEQQRPEDACTALEAALAIEPCFPYALSEYGVALVRTGRLQAARRILEEAAALAPEMEEIQTNLAVVHALLENAGDEETRRAS